MYDVECPYCGESQDINHDDGYGYEEDETYQQECCACDKVFIYKTTVSFTYEAQQADCLNGGEHRWRKLTTLPAWWPEARVCKDCDKRDLGKRDEEAVAEFMQRTFS